MYLRPQITLSLAISTLLLNIAPTWLYLLPLHPTRELSYPSTALFQETSASQNPSPTDENPLDNAIDSFLLGKPSPNAPVMDQPDQAVKTALRSLRHSAVPEDGAAAFLRFCTPLSRTEQWGSTDPWKEVLRGGLTPGMLLRKIRSSPFSILLDWSSISLTEGYSHSSSDVIGRTVAFVNAALFFEEGVEPSLIQFTLKKLGGSWFIDSAAISKPELFCQEDDHDT